MDIEQLRLFLAIARLRVLSRAAMELDLSPATVSERLKALEVELGTRLFERQGRGVSPTPAGEAFRPYVERALDVLRQGEDAVQAATHGGVGSVTIAATVTTGAYLLGPALAEFQRAHPQVEVRVRSAHSWDSPGLLLDGLADLALISGPNTHLGLEVVAAFASPLILVAGRDHPAASATWTRFALAQQAWIMSFWGPAAGHFIESVRAGVSEAGPLQELSPVELVKGMLTGGTRISLLPALAARRELSTGELVALRLGDDVPRLPTWEITLLRRRNRPVSPAATALADVLLARLPDLSNAGLSTGTPPNTA
ncbi:MAG: LysR family transcriptional regulator [Anaerolineales bacterium]|nr:LysR family transcriptional regulator [Anaerolineales bacterium]